MLTTGLSESRVEQAGVLLSAVLSTFVNELFPGMDVRGAYQFRVTRNSDMFVDEEEVKDLRASLKGELQQRHFGDAVRLEVADNCSDEMANFLLQHFHLTPDDLYRTPGIVNLVRLMQVPDWVERPDLKYAPFVPGLPKALDLAQQGPAAQQVLLQGQLHEPGRFAGIGFLL